jgi:hypothetical protein
MKVDINGNICKVTREAGDPKFYGVKNASGESRLLHHVKQILNRQGHDLIKKRMWKDGHLVDDLQQYLRTRSPKSPKPHICIYNSNWAIRGAEESFNKNGEEELTVIYDFFKEEQWDEHCTTKR